MTATNGRAMKAKGSQWERDVVKVLRNAGHQFVERAYGAGRHDDRGDIDGLPGFVIEAKNCGRIELGPWMDEAVREASHGACIPVVVIKRRNRAATDGFVVMRLSDWAELVRDGDA